MTHKFRIWLPTCNSYMKSYSYDKATGNCEVAGIHTVGVLNSLYLNPNTSQDTCVFEQWTGLTDKNGKEIFEGDILSCDHHVYDGRYKNKPRIEKIIGKVFWHHSYYAVAGYKLFIMDDDSYEVLGNIHENPDILSILAPES